MVIEDYILPANMDYIKLRQISVCFAIALHCLASSVAQVEDECSPRCWDPVRPNSGVSGATLREGVFSEEECKALCLNTESCIGIDWDKENNRCWFQRTPLPSYNLTNLNHWSVANCTDDCVSYCWRPVKIDFHVFGGFLQSDIRDENHCKLRCSNTTNCTGIDWDSNYCYLILTGTSTTRRAGVRHWNIARTLSTKCQTNSTQYSIYTSTVRTTKDNTSPTVSNTSNTMAPLQSSTKSSENFISGVIVLAVLLGLCILIIIGLVINTIRIGRKPHQKSDVKSVELGDKYESIQRAETKAKSEDGTYTDLVHGNPNEPVYEPTN